ncbi:MAG: hypothetical protein EBU06_05620 [Micrococcales bacterium]|nr:hypothetical protein [Micrococcales bacterium]NDE88489.1 hypothetical protein [Micrococcales bacterium]
MNKLVISDGVAFIKLSRLERFLLGRPYLAFEVSRISTLYMEKRPKRQELGDRKSPNFLNIFRVGEYLLGVKRILVIGPKSEVCLKILLMSPHFDEIMLTGKSIEVDYVELSKYAKIVSSRNAN